jgi:hypothetical protein
LKKKKRDGHVHLIKIMASVSFQFNPKEHTYTGNAKSMTTGKSTYEPIGGTLGDRTCLIERLMTIEGSRYGYHTWWLGYNSIGHISICKTTGHALITMSPAVMS